MSSFSWLLTLWMGFDKNIDIVLSYILAYISYISSQKKILSFQEHINSNFAKQLPHVLSEDFLCETQGASLYASKWKILIRIKMISLTIVTKGMNI